MEIQIPYEKYGLLYDEIQNLSKKYGSDAGYDFQVFGIEETIEKTDHIPRILHPGESFLIDKDRTYKIFCGVRLCIPQGHFGMFVPRSSTRRKGLVVLSVWDAGFTGWVSPFITTVVPFFITRGERLIQLIVLPVTPCYMYQGLMPETERGSKGDGSTGKL